MLAVSYRTYYFRQAENSRIGNLTLVTFQHQSQPNLCMFLYLNLSYYCNIWRVYQTKVPPTLVDTMRAIFNQCHQAGAYSRLSISL